VYNIINYLVSHQCLINIIIWLGFFGIFNIKTSFLSARSVTSTEKSARAETGFKWFGLGSRTHHMIMQG